MVVMSALVWGGYEWVMHVAQTKIDARLSARGLCIQYADKTWSPWRGLKLKDAVLCRLSADHEPLVEISALHVNMLWSESWRAHAAITRWRANDASLTLHDEVGAVTLDHFTTDFAVREDKIDLSHLDTRNGAIAFALAGEIITAAAVNEPINNPFNLNLKPLRAVMDALNVKSDKGPFTVNGTFALDLRGTPVIWNAKLHGTGKQVEWRGMPMQEADVNAELSQAELKLGAHLKFVQGSAAVALTRAGWKQEPLSLSGTVTDSAGRVDKITGNHEGATNTLTITSLSGSADLIELARNFPALAAQIPTAVSVKTFPDIVLTDFVLNAAAQPPEWRFSSLQLRTPAVVGVTVAGHPLEIDHITGHVSHQRDSWQFDDVKARLLHARFALEGDYEGSTLSVSGTVTDSAGRTDNFKGRQQAATDTLTISRLSGDADLLEIANNLPVLAAKIPAGLKVGTFPDIAVKDFIWHAGEHPKWSLAELQLRKSADLTLMVRDHPLNINRLTGRLAFEQGTWSFVDLKGRLLDGDFALSGSYDGHTLSKTDLTLQSLHLARLSPWLGKVSSSLDESKLSLAYRGAISKAPLHSTGSGTLALTNAPVVHVPLLDQTYQLFPNVLPHEHPDGTGEFQVAFSMTNGIATIDPFNGRSESLTITATGTIDLVKRQVAGRARANLRGIVGIATSPLSHLLTEMQVSGPLDDVRVSPLSPVAGAKNLITGTLQAATGTASGAVKLSSSVLRESLSIPFEALDVFGNDKGTSDSN